VDDSRAGSSGQTTSDYPTQKLNYGVDPSSPNAIDLDDSTHFTNTLFAVILLLGILIRLSGIANNISIDREWLPVLAPSSASSASTTSSYDLTHLNAVLRRIDLICKILTPLLITAFVSIARSYRICIISLGLLAVLSWVAELRCARWMYESSSALRARKPQGNQNTMSTRTTTGENQSFGILRLWHPSRTFLLPQFKVLSDYFSTTVWIPATAQALLHLTVLAYSSSLITYLLEVGFSLKLITTARAAGSIVEVGSTILTPWAVHYLSGRQAGHDVESDDVETEGFLDQDKGESQSIDSIALEKVGLFGISWQFCSLVRFYPSLKYCSERLLTDSRSQSSSRSSISPQDSTMLSMRQKLLSQLYHPCSSFFPFQSHGRVCGHTP
jgi:solute carrier family 40 (iron-regulated transporter), member 1